jgi:predicted transcriptional regulator
MTKSKIREIFIRESKGNFFFDNKQFEKKDYDFDGLSSLKKLLSKEKARILDAIKYKNPGSIYELAKLLKKPFKATVDDLKLLERFGFIELTEEKVNGRKRMKPVIISDHVIIHLNI